MKPVTQILLLFAGLILTQACNTLYSTRVVNIEILEPAKVKLPEEYKTVAVRYNNINVAWNPRCARYSLNGASLTDLANLDSIASHEYFDQFITSLKYQQIFDNIYVLKAEDYSHTEVIDGLSDPSAFSTDSIKRLNEKETLGLQNSFNLSKIIGQVKPLPSAVQQKRTLDPIYGLYSKAELEKISDTCNADLLLSLDFFYTLSDTRFYKTFWLALNTVLVNFYWSAYDLKLKEPAFYMLKTDTIEWRSSANHEAKKYPGLPSRKDATMNAANITGTNAAEFLVPHWINVDRIYYQSGHVDLKHVDGLVDKGEWLEAAKGWKANINNPNRKIAAKCMFNMGVACEMNDEMDAAIEWVVKSYHVFGEKNEIHADNCKEYIKILGYRKLDKNLINQQLSFENKF